jgi:hypothetical protein
MKPKTLITLLSGTHRQDFHTTVATIADYTFLLTTEIVSGAKVTVLHVEALSKTILVGQHIQVVSGELEQTFVVAVERKREGTEITVEELTATHTFPVGSFATRLGSTEIGVESQTPNFAYPSTGAGTLLFASAREQWRRVGELGETVRTLTFTVPAANKGVTGKDIEVRVRGGFEGTFKARSRLVTVP